MADLLIKSNMKSNMKYNIANYYLLSSCKGEGTRKKGEVPISQIHNINEVEEGRRRVELAECVRSEDKKDELEKHATSYSDR